MRMNKRALFLLLISLFLFQTHERFNVSGRATANAEESEPAYKLKLHYALEVKSPKEHLTSGRLYFEAELEDELLPFTVQLLGDRGLVFASDFPHFTRADSIAESVKRFQARRDLSDETKRRILGENARRLYKIKS